MRRHRAMRALRILLRSVGSPSFTKARPFRVLLYAASLLLLSVNLGRLAFIPGNGSSYPCHLRRASFEENLLPIDQMPGFNKQVSSKADHLIVVPGHAVTIRESLENVDVDDGSWFLLDYQRNQGMPGALVAHIREGVALAKADPHSLLVYSGGQTRPRAGPRSEAVSYYFVADHFNWWNVSKSVRQRATVEEFATDSFENLMYSVCRFREVVGKYPRKITVVGFAFKKTRFEELHAPALRFPKDSFHYVGIDPPASTGFNVKRMVYWEKKASFSQFKHDLYGCHSRVLLKKRKQRNPFSRTPPYPLSCPEMSNLLRWCGPKKYGQRLPWEAGY